MKRGSPVCVTVTFAPGAAVELTVVVVAPVIAAVVARWTVKLVSLLAAFVIVSVTVSLLFLPLPLHSAAVLSVTPVLSAFERSTAKNRRQC
ncbi:MAG: hypothetical protein ABSG97_04840 [Sedimentisphaerales bacterium]